MSSARPQAPPPSRSPRAAAGRRRVRGGSDPARPCAPRRPTRSSASRASVLRLRVAARSGAAGRSRPLDRRCASADSTPSWALETRYRCRGRERSCSSRSLIAVSACAAQAHRAGQPRVRRQQPHDRERRHGFSRSRGADQPENFAGRRRSSDTILEDRRRRRSTRSSDRSGEQRRGSVLAAVMVIPAPAAAANRRPADSVRARTTTRRSPETSASDGASAVSVCASLSMRPQLGVGGCAPRPT